MHRVNFKLDLVPLPPRLLQNRDIHIDYHRHTQEQANTLQELVEQAKVKQPLDKELDFACNKRNDRISQTPSRNKKNKVEAQPRKVNKMNRVVKPVCDVDVKHSLSNANSEILCATCNKSMFDGVHDKCSSKIAKIVESKNANHSEPNQTWGSNATYIPSYSSLVMTGKDWKDKKKQKRSKTDKKREKDKETKSKSENSARDHSRISPTQSKIEIKKVKEIPQDHEDPYSFSILQSSGLRSLLILESLILIMNIITNSFYDCDFSNKICVNEAGPSYDSNTPFEVQDHDTFVDHMDEYHEVHEMQSDVQHNYVVDSDADYTSDSNIIPYDQYVEDNEEHVVQSNVSSVRNDALMSILDEMHEQGVQSRSANKQVKVVNDTLTSELARYKELVGVYEQRAKFELTDRERKIDEQMRIIISDRNRKETSLKSELHSAQLQLRSTLNHHKIVREEAIILKKDFKQKEDKFLEEFLDIKRLKEKVEDRLYKQDQSVQTVHMICKPKSFYDEKNKVAIGYKNPLCLTRAKQVQPALYNGHVLVMSNHACLVVHDSEDTRDMAEITRKRMIEKMQSPLRVENKVRIAPPRLLEREPSCNLCSTKKSDPRKDILVWTGGRYGSEVRGTVASGTRWQCGSGGYELLLAGVRAEEIERNRVHEETMQMLREMIKIQEEKRIFEEAARQEDEKRIATEKEAAELEAKRKSQECLNIEEKSIPQASIRSRKSRIDPTLRNFTISTKRIPFSTVKTVNSLKMGDKHLDTQKGSLESSVKDPIPIPSESDVISDGDCDDDYQKRCFIPIPPGIDERCFNAESDLLESLQNHEIPIDSTKIDSIFDEFSLPRPPEIPSFSQDVMDLVFDDSIPPGIDDDDDSEGDILPLEELLDDVLFLLPKSDNFTFVEPVATMENNIEELNEDESFDPGGGGNVVLPNVEEDDTFTLTIRTFLPFVTYPEVSLLSCSPE
ncbi:hypothetical protein Tco_0655812 [Tanacetum coccineum]|uniref:Uncharacterized protein n=1 Tax=Tanacetum coccineum TaxID=301880 RepID=A0ABQ4X7L1_9ASTR